MTTTQQTTETKNRGGVDRFGAVASTACAIHCAACALIPASLAALGLDFLIGHKTEWALAGVAMVFAFIALIMSIRSHRNGLIIAALSIGIVGLLSARILEGQAHHGHGEHAEEGKHAEDGKHTDEGKHDDHAKHDEHGDGHWQIEALGISAGFLLVIGHIGNLVLLRRKREDDCAPSCASDS